MRAHLALADAALQYMKQTTDKSKAAYMFLKRFRIRSIFLPRGLARVMYKAMWILGLLKIDFVLIADYQMVCPSTLLLYYW